MSSDPIFNRIGIAIVFLILFAVLPFSASAGAVIGPRAGYDFDSENFVLGAEAEFGQVLQSFKFAPGVDFEFGDNSITAFNADLRLYLFNLPETGPRFYGSAGPTVLLDSRGAGDTQTEIGLSFVAGTRIPMKGQKRDHLEARFGIGDISELKVMLAVLFGV